MKRILFVDDDISVLEALRVRLQRMQHKWAMTFVASGGQALAECQWYPYDLIVSDIRMPGMSGARLLRAVSERWPQTVRIALSDYLDQQQPTQLLSMAHQVLSKPCEPQQLERVIERCLRLQELVCEPALRALVGRIQRLPPLRSTYAKLNSILAGPAVTAHDIAPVIASDSVITAKLLQTVTSAVFRHGRRIADIEEAVSHLGITNVRKLVMSAEVFAQWPQNPTPAALDLERLQQHTDAVAKVARVLTAHTPIAADTVLAALLHDIGYRILAQECPHELRNAVELARTQCLPMHEAERQVIGASHAEIGAYLLGLWGLPHSVVEAVAHHHASECAGKTGFNVSAALAVASALSGSDEADSFHGAPGTDSPVGPEYLESLQAPFDWSEATRRATECLKSGATLS